MRLRGTCTVRASGGPREDAGGELEGSGKGGASGPSPRYDPAASASFSSCAAMTSFWISLVPS